MAKNRRTIAADPDRVWAVLSDGWRYPTWVVGATRMRDVDAHWPDVGAQLHHSVGVWPLVLDDTTEVVRSEPARLLEVRARAWPTGEAAVTIRIEPDGAHSTVTMEEDAVSGPGRLVPAPLRHLPIKWRNVEALRRLAYICEGEA